MKRGILAALAACVLLSGCSTLLERSYSVVEPYADRYWDTGAEDTLRVDNYQDLVNSLLMLIEQRTEEAVIHCYDEVNSQQMVMESRNEVRWDTMQGSYLLQGIQFTFEEGINYSTAAFRMTYREDAEDLSSVMTLSDSQSLMDLLRLALREEHGKITAWFTYNTPREAVTAVVENCWQELCREEMEDASLVVSTSAEPPEGEIEGGELPDGAEDLPEDLPEDAPEDVPAEPEDVPEESAPAPEEPDETIEGPAPKTPDGEEEGEAPDPESIVYPPCPWIVRFYPDQETAELVEILLKTT